MRQLARPVWNRYTDAFSYHKCNLKLNANLYSAAAVVIEEDDAGEEGEDGEPCIILYFRYYCVFLIHVSLFHKKLMMSLVVWVQQPLLVHLTSAKRLRFVHFCLYTTSKNVVIKLFIAWFETVIDRFFFQVVAFLPLKKEKDAPLLPALKQERRSLVGSVRPPLRPAYIIYFLFWW
jgi:hypothetical protein